MSICRRCERSVTILALGGGVIGDLTGFAAATYLDLLESHAFGNYRDLLGQISTKNPLTFP